MKVQITRDSEGRGHTGIEIVGMLRKMRSALDTANQPINEMGWKELNRQRHEFKKQLDDLTDASSSEGRSLTALESEVVESVKAAISRLDLEMDKRGQSGNRDGEARRSGRAIEEESTQKQQGVDGFRDVRSGKFVRMFKPDERVASFGMKRDAGTTLHLGHIALRAATGAWQDEQIQEEARAMSIGSDSGGGYMVPDFLSREVIDMARAQSVVMRAGARTIMMDQGTVDLARIESDPTFQWKAEGNSFSPGDLTLGRVRLTAKTVGCIIPLSEELWQDGQNIAEVLNTAIVRGLGAEMDRVCLHGSGSGAEPTGIYNAANINTYLVGSAPSSYDFVSQAVQAVRADNHEPNAAIANPRTYGQLDRLKEATTNAPLMPPESYRALRHFSTTNVRANLENPGSPTETTTGSCMFVGKFDELLVGTRLGVQIYASRDGYDGTNHAFKEFKVLIRAVMRLDLALLRPAAFCVAQDIRAS